PVRVCADVFRDGHDILAARVRWRALAVDNGKWREVPMHHVDPGNDRWEAVIEPTSLGLHELVVEGWTDRYATWRHDVEVKRQAGQDVDVELEEGALLLEQMADELSARGMARELPAAEHPALVDAAAALRDADSPMGRRLTPAFDP